MLCLFQLLPLRELIDQLGGLGHVIRADTFLRASCGLKECFWIQLPDVDLDHLLRARNMLLIKVNVLKPLLYAAIEIIGHPAANHEQLILLLLGRGSRIVLTAITDCLLRHD